jgi:hypothetical protein
LNLSVFVKLIKGDASEEALHRCHDRGIQCGWSSTLCHSSRLKQRACSEEQEGARVHSANDSEDREEVQESDPSNVDQQRRVVKAVSVATTVPAGNLSNFVGSRIDKALALGAVDELRRRPLHYRPAFILPCAGMTCAPRPGGSSEQPATPRKKPRPAG